MTPEWGQVGEEKVFLAALVSPRVTGPLALVSSPTSMLLAQSCPTGSLAQGTTSEGQGMGEGCSSVSLKFSLGSL